MRHPPGDVALVTLGIGGECTAHAIHGLEITSGFVPTRVKNERFRFPV